MHRFDQDIKLTETEPFRYRGNITENWSINGTPNGGYLMAILANAMLAHSDKPSIAIITAGFLMRCTPGETETVVEKIAQSNRFDRLQARLMQEGIEKVRAVGTFAEVKNEQAETRHEGAAPVVAGPAECIVIPAIPHYTVYDWMEVRLDPECAGWMTTGKLNATSELKGWIKFKDNRPFDILSLLLVADAFPPPVLASHGIIAWVPTIEFSLNIRNAPTTEWLKCIFRTRFIDNGIVAEDGEIWDETGKLIAISRQIAQFRKAGA